MKPVNRKSGAALTAALLGLVVFAGSPSSVPNLGAGGRGLADRAGSPGGTTLSAALGTPPATGRAIPPTPPGPGSSLDHPAQLGAAKPQPPAKRVRERVGDRTATTKTFDLADGRRQAEVGTRPVHYRDASGRWQNLDTTVRPSGDAAYPYAVEKNAFTSHFGRTSDRLVSYRTAGRGVTVGLDGPAAAASPTVSGNTVLYGGVAAGADLVYEVTGDAAKEKIVLHGPPSGDASYTFVLGLDGVEATQTADGAVAFSAAGGVGPPLFYLPRPFMYDSRDDAASPYGKSWSGKVTQTLHRDGARTLLTVTADREWLSSKDRKYPVVVDPTIKIQPTVSQSQDAMIVSDSPSTNYDGSWRLSVGPTSSSVARSLLKFDLSNIPTGTQIDSAQLQTYFDQTHTSDAYDVAIEARRVTTAWTENAVTWTSANAAFAEAGQNLEQVDNADAGKTAASGSWASLSSTQAIGGGYRTNSDATTGNTFTWVPRVTEAGSYEVQVHYVPGTDRAINAPYTVYHAGATPTTVAVNQTTGSGSGVWKPIGTWTFNAGTTHKVVLGDVASKVVVADAVRLVKKGVDTKKVNQSNAWHTFSVRSTVQAWLDGTQSNYGFMLKATDETFGRGGPRYEAAEYAYNGENEQTPKLLLTYGRPGPTLTAPGTIRATGADLTWSAYQDPSTATGDDLVEYQVHRSVWQNFAPSATTLIAPLGDTTLSYNDTSAPPTPADSTDPFGAAYYYIVVAKTRDGTLVPSQTQLVRLPKAGRVVKVLQNAVDTTVSKTESTTGHDVLAGNPWVMTGNNSGTYGVTRSLAKFPSLGIPAGARVLDAEVSLWGFYTYGSGASYEMRGLTTDFDEATASWARASSATAWTTAGGDMGAATPGTVSVTNDPAWRGFDATALAQSWVDNASNNKGVLVKLVNETSPLERTIFLSGEAAEPQLRPKLVVVYTQPTASNTYYAPTTPSRMIPGDQYTVPVTLTNTTATTWPAATWELSYRWELADGTDKTNAGNQRATALPADLPAGSAVTLNAAVMTPIRSDEGNKREAFVLKWDLRNKSTGQWLSQSAGIPPLAQDVAVEDPTSDQLGLEKFYQYTGDSAGAGSSVMVNQFSGNAIFGYNAFSNPSRGLSTFFRITYNSQDTSDSYVGYGWSLSATSVIRLGSPLQFRGNNTWPQEVDLTDGDGTSHEFTLNKHNSTDQTLWDYDQPAGVHLYLQRVGSGNTTREWVMTRPDRTQFYFDSDGYQSAIVDKNGNTMTFVYERKQGSGRNVGVLKQIIDPAARQTLTLNYYARGDSYQYFPGDSDTKTSGTNLTSGQIVDKLKSVTDVSGRRIDLIYSDKGVMRQLIDGANDTSKQKVFGFFYDTTIGAPRARLLRVSDPRNNSTKLTYFDTNAGPLLRLRAQKIIDRLDKTTALNYTDPDGTAGSQISSTVTDANNHTSTYLIDGYGRTTLMTNAKAEKTELTWDADNNVRRLAEDNGAVTTWVYDPKTGNPLEIKDPEANKNNTDPMILGYRTGLNGHTAELTSKTSPEKRAWSFGYDTFGNLTSVTDPKGTSTSLAGDYTTSYTYDTFGQLQTETDANEHSTTYSAYDPVGYPTTITDAKQFKTQYTYDKLGNVLTVTDARLKTSTYTYDLFGRPRTSQVPKDQAAGAYINTPEPSYDPNDNVLAETAPNGAVTQAGYDAADRTTFILEPPDTTGGPERRTTYGYDNVGNLVRETEPNGSATATPTDDFTTTYTYDVLNRVVQGTDANGGKVTTDYDNVGNVSVVADQRKNATADTTDFTAKYSYDFNHRTLSSTDPAGKVMRSEYDKDSNVTGQVDQENNKTILVYDQRSDLIAQKVPYTSVNGVITYHTTAYEYDEVGNQTKVVTPRGVDTTDDADDFATVTVYNELNQVIEERRPYDKDDVRYTTTDTFTYAYDEVGNVKETTAPPSQGETTRPKTTYTYWDNGWTRSSTDPWSIRTDYDYDAIGSQISRTLTGAGGATRTQNWTYFPDGKKKTQSDDGDGSGTARKSFEYSYDLNANMTQLLDKSSNAKVDKYTVSYDGVNRVDIVKEYLGTTLKNTTDFDYDLNDDLLKRTHDRQIAEYTYDVRDLVSTVKNSKSASDPKPKTARFTYTDRAQKDVETKANGNTVDYDYYLDGSLKHQVEKKPSGSVVNEHTIDYDANGNRSKDVGHKQNADNKSAYLDTTTTYDYDPRDRVRTVTKTGSGAGTESYIHDANDNVIEQTLKNVKTTFNYDRNRLTSSVTAGVTSNYQYDAYGRLYRVTAAGIEIEKYVYDGFDRTVSHTTTAGGTTTYTYDPLDRQTSRTHAGKTTDLVYLGLTDKVLAEMEGTKVRKSYQYGPNGDLLSQTNTKDDGTEENAYHGYNAHSDVEQLTDDQGDAKATYGYTAYGKNDDSQFTGIDKPDPAKPDDPNAEPYNVYRFNGKRWDQATGDYDMGFRDYDPGLNRFLSRDSYNGALADLDLQTDPFTQNRYAFAGGNPISNVELDGHFSWSDIGHAALDVAGLVPGVGEVADLANAAWYAAEGDYGNAALSAASAIPFAGYAASAAKGVKYAAKGVDAAQSASKAADAAKGAGRAADAAQSAGKAAPSPTKAASGGSGPTPAKAAGGGGSAGPAKAAGGGGGYRDLYHGTSKSGAANVRSKGIDLSAGKPNRDFGRGFYTTDNLKQAQTWAAKNADGGEVLHYRVPNSELDSLSTRTFSRPDADWARFVLHHRSGGKPHGYDAVEGPLLLNPRDALAGKALESSGQQLSFHTPGAVSMLNRYLVK